MSSPTRTLICLPVAAPRAITIRRRCGWWTKVGTEATVQALRNFLSLTENELEKMGRNGRKLVEEKYSARKVAEEFVEMYKSIL